MFLRRNRRKIRGADYVYWTLVECVRTARGPRQRVVATIGKLSDFKKEERVGWEEIGRILNGEPAKAADLFEEHKDIPEWATVNTRGIQIERLRRFGDVYLGLALWKRLKLDQVFETLQKEGREEISWANMFCVLAIARMCQPSSELAIAESWYEKTALEDLLGISVDKVNESRLYRSLDHLLPHKDDICKHLQDRYAEWFGSKFDFLFYDITSTYFEGQCPHNEQAKYGYSRDNRPDCKQVCVGLVVNSDGLPIGYEIFDGNRRDVTTLEEMVELMEDKYGKAQRVWVLDRGFVSEENLDFLRERGARYIVGTPRAVLKNFEKELDARDWSAVEFGVEVKIVKHPDHGAEKFILCRSEGRKEKERAMLERQLGRLDERLRKIKAAITSGRLTDALQAAKRIGRWSGRYSKAERLIDVELIQDASGSLVDLKIERRMKRADWAEKTAGCYLLRTNLAEENPEKLWKAYMQLVQAEKAFRLSKSDLGMRPVFHQEEHRVQAHIFVCFLALAMYKSLELWMDSKGLGNSPAKLLEEFREIRSMDIIMPVKDRNPVRLRIVAKPDEHVRVLLQKLGIKIPNRPKTVENVVENLTPKILQPIENKQSFFHN
jgi:transposase